jgi:hypothetical protein
VEIGSIGCSLLDENVTKKWEYGRTNGWPRKGNRSRLSIGNSITRSLDQGMYTYTCVFTNDRPKLVYQAVKVPCPQSAADPETSTIPPSFISQYNLPPLSLNCRPSIATFFKSPLTTDAGIRSEAGVRR